MAMSYSSCSPTALCFRERVAFNALGLVESVEMSLFIAVLVVGFWYAWKKGALERD
jgi:NADH-quinone oxidoreductase subunit A